MKITAVVRICFNNLCYKNSYIIINICEDGRVCHFFFFVGVCMCVIFLFFYRLEQRHQLAFALKGAILVYGFIFQFIVHNNQNNHEAWYFTLFYYIQLSLMKGFISYSHFIIKWLGLHWAILNVLTVQVNRCFIEKLFKC